MTSAICSLSIMVRHANDKTSDDEPGGSRVLQREPDRIRECERNHRVPHHCDRGRKWQPPPLARLDRKPSDNEREHGDHETDDKKQFIADGEDPDNSCDGPQQAGCERHAAERLRLVRALRPCHPGSPAGEESEPPRLRSPFKASTALSYPWTFESSAEGKTLDSKREVRWRVVATREPSMVDLQADVRAASDVRSWLPLSILLIIGGAIGWLASTALLIERVRSLQNPQEALACDISPFVSCGALFDRWQASLLGFPNPVIGVAGFVAPIVVGLALLAGARFAPWFWRIVVLGLFGAWTLARWPKRELLTQR